MTVSIEFAGEWFSVDSDVPFLIGREGTLQLDDNPYLHRRFLIITQRDGMYWIANVGSRLSATLADEGGQTQAYLAHGERLPLVYARTILLFTAGPTTYEMTIINENPPYSPSNVLIKDETSGKTRIGPVEFTPAQKVLIVALAEPALTGMGTTWSIPSSKAVAERLGWPLTSVNRELDDVCERLTRHGVRGLSGSDGRTVNRRARLVQYSVATRLVTVADLDLLDRPRGVNN